MAAAAIAPKTVRATVCGRIACCTSLRVTSERLIAKVRPFTFWWVIWKIFRCTELASVARWRCRPGMPAVLWASRTPTQANS